MATVRRFRNIAVLLPALLVFANSEAIGAGGRGSCGAPAGSAIAQYCESFPSATGGSQPHVGTPSVAKQLPKHDLQVLNNGSAAEQHLLTIPAAKRHHVRRVRAAAGLSGPDASIWSLSLLMILILAAIALGLGGIAIERRRRRSPQPPAGP
jgi:hypothetical protein